MLKATLTLAAAMAALGGSALAKEAPPAKDASGVAIGEEKNGLSRCDERYLRRYVAAYEAGFDVGRNKVDDGVMTENGVEPVSNGEACQEAAQLHTWLHPPPPPEPVVTETTEPTAYVEPAPATPEPSYGSSGTSWDAVAACESGGNWSISTGNGYYGGLQMDSAFWDAYGNPAYGEANEAPISEQIAAAEAGQAVQGDSWPNC